MKIRLVGDNIPDGGGVYEKDAAHKLADDLNLDLVQISKGQDYPVYKILNKEKYLYELKKKEKDKNKSKSKLKEIRLTPNISDGDVNTKLNHAIKFSEKGFSLKVTMFFKGAQMRNQNIGKVKLLEFIESLEDYYKPTSVPKMSGRRMDVIMNPKNKIV